MEYKTSHPEKSEWVQAETTMMAAELFAKELFDQADNDSMYHNCVSSVRYALAHGQCQYEPEEIAERILAWSGAL